MNLSEIAITCGKLVKAYEHHHEMAAYFHRLFNLHTPGNIKEPGEYTDLQRFYQNRAQYHLVEMYKAEKAMKEFQELGDTELMY